MQSALPGNAFIRKIRECRFFQRWHAVIGYRLAQEETWIGQAFTKPDFHNRADFSNEGRSQVRQGGGQGVQARQYQPSIAL